MEVLRFMVWTNGAGMVWDINSHAQVQRDVLVYMERCLPESFSGSNFARSQLLHRNPVERLAFYQDSGLIASERVLKVMSSTLWGNVISLYSNVMSPIFSTLIL